MTTPTTADSYRAKIRERLIDAFATKVHSDPTNAEVADAAMAVIELNIQDSELLDFADADGHHDASFPSLRSELRAALARAAGEQP